MFMRKTIVAGGIVLIALSSGCYTTFDITARELVQINGFRAGETRQAKTSNNGTVDFTKDSEFTFVGQEGSMAQLKFSRIDIDRNVLAGEDAETGAPVYIDLSRMKSIQAEKYSPVLSTIAGFGIGIPVVVVGVLVCCGSGLAR